MSSKKRRYARDWAKYDENLVIKYEMMFPSHV